MGGKRPWKRKEGGWGRNVLGGVAAVVFRLGQGSHVAAWTIDRRGAFAEVGDGSGGMVCLCDLGLVLLDGHGLLGVVWGGVVLLAGIVFLLGLVVDGWEGHGGVLLLLGVLVDLVVVGGAVRQVVSWRSQDAMKRWREAGGGGFEGVRVDLLMVLHRRLSVCWVWFVGRDRACEMSVMGKGGRLTSGRRLRTLRTTAFGWIHCDYGIMKRGFVSRC